MVMKKSIASRSWSYFHSALAVFRRRHSFEFLELSHKMYLAAIPAEGREGIDIHVTVSQIKFCEFQACVYGICLRRDCEELFVQMLKIDFIYLKAFILSISLKN